MNAKVAYIPIQGIIGVWEIAGINDISKKCIELCAMKELLIGSILGRWKSTQVVRGNKIIQGY